MLSWIYFIVATSIMYLCIVTVGRLTGGEGVSVLDSVKQLFTPMLLFLVLSTNVLFAIGIYYGFIVSSNALTISVAIGVVISFIYSIVTLGVSVSVTKLIGLALLIIGIYLLR